MLRLVVLFAVLAFTPAAAAQSPGQGLGATLGELLRNPDARAVLDRRAPDLVALYDGGQADPNARFGELIRQPRAGVPASHAASLDLELRAAQAGQPRVVWSTRSRVVDLMADREAFAVMGKHIPRIVAQIEFATGIQVPLNFTLENFLHVPESQVTRELLDEIQADLDLINTRENPRPVG